MLCSNIRAFVASMAMSMLIVGADAICPAANISDPDHEAHKQQLTSIDTCIFDHPRYACMQKQGSLCDTMPTVFADCTKTFGEVYDEFYGKPCAQDEVMCATAYNEVVEDFCNASGCPKSKDNFLDLFNTLGSCGYLAKAGGDPALESYEASSACLKQRGVCKLDSPNSMLRYASCKELSKQLLFEGDTSLELGLMSEVNDCYIKEFLPEDRCNAEFGFQVTNSYCPVETESGGETNDTTTLAIVGSVVAVGALLMIFFHYRKSPIATRLSNRLSGVVQTNKSIELKSPQTDIISEHDDEVVKSTVSTKNTVPLRDSFDESEVKLESPEYEL